MSKALALLWACLWTSAAWADVPVVASIKPLHALAAAVMEGAGSPEVLVKGAGSAHIHSLKPSDAKLLSEAAVVFWIGPTFETFLVRPFGALGGKARVVALGDVPGTKRIGTDGHIWLDPTNAKVIASAMAETLAGADPANAARYRTNARELAARIDTLDAELIAKLASIKDKPFFVFHDAYQYFGEHYGLDVRGHVTTNPERPAGARHLQHLKAEIAALPGTCVFAEPQFEPKLIATLTVGTRARSGVLDPEGSGLAPGPQLYFNLMHELADGLVGCLATP